MTIDPDPVRPFGGGWRVLADLLAAGITLMAIAWAMSLPRMLGIGLYPQQFFAALLALTLPLAFLILPARMGAPRPAVPWYDIALAALSALAYGYVAVGYPWLVLQIFSRPPEIWLPGIVIVLLTLEALRRATGWALVIIICVFLLYALFGDMIPGRLSGRPQNWQLLAGYMAVDFERHPRPADLGRGDRGGGLHPVRHAPRHHRRLAVLHRRRDDRHGPLPRRLDEDRGAGLGPVRLDLRLGGGQCRRHRRRHHPDDQARRLPRPQGRGDRGGGLHRRPADAPRHGRLRLPDGRVPRDPLFADRHGGAGPRAPLLRRAVHPGRSRGRQARHPPRPRGRHPAPPPRAPRQPFRARLRGADLPAVLEKLPARARRALVRRRPLPHRPRARLSRRPPRPRARSCAASPSPATASSRSC